MRLKHFNIELGCRVFSACADPARLRILNLIMQNGGMCVRDLKQILSFTQTKTSRHLIYLKNAGILYTHRQHQWVIYRIKEEISDTIEQILQFIQHDTILREDQTTYRNMYEEQQLAVNRTTGNIHAA